MPNAYYWQAYALGRYAQGISIVKALAQGIGGKVKTALETAIKLAPKHADAHIALGCVSRGGDRQSRRNDRRIDLRREERRRDEELQTALKLNPDSAIARIEYANGLVMLEGKKALKQAEPLYAEAAAMDAIDAMEKLDVEQAKAEIED